MSALLKREFGVRRRAFISQPLRPCTARSHVGTVRARSTATASSDDVVDVALPRGDESDGRDGRLFTALAAPLPRRAAASLPSGSAPAASNAAAAEDDSSSAAAAPPPAPLPTTSAAAAAAAAARPASCSAAAQRASVSTSAAHSPSVAATKRRVSVTRTTRSSFALRASIDTRVTSFANDTTCVTRPLLASMVRKPWRQMARLCETLRDVGPTATRVTSASTLLFAPRTQPRAIA